MAISDEDLAQSRSISVEQVRLLRESRGTTNDTLEALPETDLRRALRRLNYPDLPRARHAFLLAQARDDDGNIAANALGNAFKQLRALRRDSATRPHVAGVPVARSMQPLAMVGIPSVAGLTGNRWQWLGPGNIGGRTRAIVVHPADPKRMLAASAGGGVWFTQDGGGRWDPVDDFMANLAVCCLATDPKHPNLVYAGTGEGFSNVDALRGAGIFRVTGGATWQQIAATTTPDFTAVNRIAVSHSGTVVLAATNAGIMRSIDAARATWKKVVTDEMADVKFHPKLSTRAVAGGMSNGKAYYSTNSGSTWKAATHAGAWSGRVELAYARKNPNIVYASVQMSGGEIWRSIDGGKTYQRRANLGTDGKPAQFLGDQGWYGNAIWADDPTDEKLLIVGGVDLWRSTDAGDTLAEISTWWSDNSIHADHHAIVSHPGYDGVANRTVFFGNDGGIFKADDIRTPGTEPQPPFDKGWKELNNNYGVTQFYGGAGHTGSGKIIGGAQDNGTLVYDPAAGSEGWVSMFGGDGGWCAADPIDAKVSYGEYVFLNIHRNTDGGTSSDTQGDRYITGQFFNPALNDWGWKPVPFQIPDARLQNALFIAPFVLDVRNPNRLLAGGLSLWETTDAKATNTHASGPHWRAIKSSTGKLISTIAVSPADSGVVWVGHEDGMVFRSTNGASGAPAWQRCDHTGAKPLTAARYCTRVTPHPTDPLVAYVSFGGFVKENIWVTTDGGKTWALLGSALPAAPVKAIAVHPRRTNFVYVGTEVGAFASEDGGAHWSPTNEGPANVAIDDLFWMGETLVCATHGRGMYTIDLHTV